MSELETIAAQAPAESTVTLEGGTYEILQNRLRKQGDELNVLLEKVNQARKEVFGTIDTRLIATERVTTEHNCVPYDMVPLGSYFIFGYNVHLGLKSETDLSDVFSIYQYKDNSFHPLSLQLIENAEFIADFKKLYKYYKHTHFSRFTLIGPYLYMIFRIGKSASDIKTFKWAIQGESLQYVDNRSDHEVVFPPQQEFSWKRASRDDHREGSFPHVSIQDKIFVETLHGDLTIKVEDNTDSGHGIYREEVEDKDQTLDDAEIYYAILGNIILLKIRPYQEKDFRYIVYNTKVQEARRMDAIQNSCLLLPDDQGIIFSDGYYLQTGEYKQFESRQDHMLFEKKISSPNGEDFLYVFYNQKTGLYLLLPYNLIEQTVKTPIVCHGFAIFDNGELCYFNADAEPQKHHAIRIWQTPFVGPNFKLERNNDSYLYKIGNKDIVRAMAECHELLTLIRKGDNYQNLYVDLQRLTTDILDTYHWLDNPEAFQLIAPLKIIRETASSAIEEYEKVKNIRKSTQEKVSEVTSAVDMLIGKIKKEQPSHINDYVQMLARLRELTGEVLSLKDLRYVDVQQVETYEQKLAEFTRKTSDACVQFLLREDALAPYHQQIGTLETAVADVNKVMAAKALDEEIDQTSTGLEMLIEIVSNLEIEDATETTRIIDNISAIFSELNRVKASLKSKKKALLSKEGKAEFAAQSKLISQALINYLDVSDTPEKCDEYLTKLMVQLEELEGKFAEFDEFLEEIGTQREEIYNSFEAKKVHLIEQKNKRANVLLQSADRIIKAIQNRTARFETVSELNGYFASDLMIGKVREIVKELIEIGDTVKADDIQSRLKSAREDAVRQLKDKTELFDSTGLIRFGNYQFSVNTSELGITTVVKNDTLYFHLTGTNFYEAVTHEEILHHRHLWDQSLVSENQAAYRAEYLAFKFFQAAQEDNTLQKLHELTEKKLLDKVQEYMAPRYHEGYVKGVHDHDAMRILQALLKIHEEAGLLRYPAEVRACAALCWKSFLEPDKKQVFNHRLKGAGAILKAFPSTKAFDEVLIDLEATLHGFAQQTALFDAVLAQPAAEYLFYELISDDDFVVDHQAMSLVEKFNTHLSKTKIKKDYQQSVNNLAGSPVLRYQLIRKWLHSFAEQSEEEALLPYISEATVLLFQENPQHDQVMEASVEAEMDDMRGAHTLICEGKYAFHYHDFMTRLLHFEKVIVPAFIHYTELKKSLTAQFTEALRLEEFKPRVMTSFVRNQLIDKVYLPLIGANLAKQIGTAGEGKRTDLMGMLLLISPPGYGKTTLMEYLANRLGLIFMKINGPAIGHGVTSVDPAEAPNATAREELKKLNLAFEMGDNIMIYLDDIQHCNPEFLQKFISLCDAQRKIEGVYKGKSKTYDFRGKKVCVVMAGNPYTESGEKFQIPDMLANRADIYNLGDIIGESAEVFKLSYIENCLTSNPVLHQLISKSPKDVYTFIEMAKTGTREGFDFETNYAAEEISEYIAVLQKLLVVRDTVLTVNTEYIRSAAQSDQYRTEPSFKLQGSYRDMNKMAEKVLPLMNEQELQTLILTHYENEAQTLTTGAEANLLKFKALHQLLSKEEKIRWEQIKEIFAKQQRLKGYGENNIVGQAIAQMEETIAKSLEGIRNVLGNGEKNPLE